MRDEEGGHTLLQIVDLLQSLTLLLLALLQLRNLHLLAELLQIALLAGFSGGLLGSSFVVELLLDATHVLVGLDHLSEVVAGTGEGHALLLEQTAGGGGGRLADFVEGQLAGQVVVGVLDVDGLGGDERVVFGEGRQVRDEGDALEGGVDRGGVVDRQALVGDYVFCFGVGEIGEGNVFIFVFFFFLFLLFVVVVRVFFGDKVFVLFVVFVVAGGALLVHLGIFDILLVFHFFVAILGSSLLRGLPLLRSLDELLLLLGGVVATLVVVQGLEQLAALGHPAGQLQKNKK